MKTFRIFFLALLPIFALTAETAPASSEGQGCGVQAFDPDLRPAFAHVERAQSSGAAKICALYLNSMTPGR